MSQYKTNDHLMSMTIAFLRFPLAVGVVFIHYNLAKNPFTMHGVEYGTNCAECSRSLQHSLVMYYHALGYHYSSLYLVSFFFMEKISAEQNI